MMSQEEMNAFIILRGTLEITEEKLKKEKEENGELRGKLLVAEKKIEEMQKAIWRLNKILSRKRPEYSSLLEK